VRILVMDEVDGMEPTAEGSPIRLAEGRTTQFDDRKIIIGSTPVFEESSGNVDTGDIRRRRDVFRLCSVHIQC
jgi:phage terminase large subunit GpA-like protein